LHLLTCVLTFSLWWLSWGVPSQALWQTAKILLRTLLYYSIPFMKTKGEIVLQCLFVFIFRILNHIDYWGILCFLAARSIKSQTLDPPLAKVQNFIECIHLVYEPYSQEACLSYVQLLFVSFFSFCC
jgi:hypothetical protein